ncbi:hypothetical protein K470DRAFT_261004 [Piedraia hortae CBS 480.64]|uniref:Mitochondrial escape protein 2 n=1 Tax=Piedraia hortae CBS 480.64 TaxID=1314780 RepID=A0A6A7BPH1_9PEZI|nr:hypothetical protein K470DRAFT_261004 [Piedraia hortae CBS 480.64]
MTTGRATIDPNLAGLRHATTEAGENKTGHITLTPRESILFFGNLLPIDIQWLFRYLRTSSFQRLGAASPRHVLEDAVRTNNLGITHVSVVEVLPRLKEGGAFVKFAHDEHSDPATISEAVRVYLKNQRIRPWWNPLRRVKASLVVGKPWLEDLYRLPSRRLMVEFLPTNPAATAAELSPEQLYSFFRPYGKLAEIVPQPADSKVLPRFAYLDFSHRDRAVLAKNCLHGYTVREDEGGGKDGTVLRLTYHKKSRFRWAKDFFLNHPRIVVPLLAALVAGISIAIFDPIRTASIKAHIRGHSLGKWLHRGRDFIVSAAKTQLRLGDNTNQSAVLWADREDEISTIRAWLMESTETFNIVYGPRGSGKRELVLDHALSEKHDAKKLLVVDCKPMLEARSDSTVILAAANQVGYRPVFSWMNSISGLIDLAAQGVTGVKAGFSETLETQLNKIWLNTAVALKQIALSQKEGESTDDEWLLSHPEARPVVVIDNFLFRTSSSEGSKDMINQKLASWAADLTTTNVAHVIFLTDDVAFGKTLAAALPGRVFRHLTLGDCETETALRYVHGQLEENSNHHHTLLHHDSSPASDEKPQVDLSTLPQSIATLGGRLSDLEFLSRRIRAGETPEHAVREIISIAAAEITKMFLLPGPQRGFTEGQAWTIVRSLASDQQTHQNPNAHPSWNPFQLKPSTETDPSGVDPSAPRIGYHTILLTPPFKTAGEAALAALEQAELITIEYSDGRPASIRPGRPVYSAVFAKLVKDPVLSARMDLGLVGERIKAEEKKVEAAEEELKLIGGLARRARGLEGRVEYLVQKVDKAQRSVVQLEGREDKLRGVLEREG